MEKCYLCKNSATGFIRMEQGDWEIVGNGFLEKNHFAICDTCREQFLADDIKFEMITEDEYKSSVILEE